MVAAGLGTFLELSALSALEEPRNGERPDPAEVADAYRHEGQARGCWVGGLLLTGFGSYYLLTSEEPEAVAR